MFVAWFTRLSLALFLLEQRAFEWKGQIPCRTIPSPLHTLPDKETEVTFDLKCGKEVM